MQIVYDNYAESSRLASTQDGDVMASGLFWPLSTALRREFDGRGFQVLKVAPLQQEGAN
jgi:hypothetical protein